MAKINGVELKSKRPIKNGSEEGFGAFIYMDNERIGTVKDEADGFGIQIRIPKTRDEILFRYRTDDYTKSLKYFIRRLIELNDIEKCFKNETKKTNTAFELIEIQKIDTETEMPKSAIDLYLVKKGSSNERIEELKREGVEFDSVNVFTSLNDFNVNVVNA